MAIYTSLREIPAGLPYNHFSGSRMAPASSPRNSAARAPSTTRWSLESVMVIIGRMPGFPSTGTTASAIAPTARIALCGGVMIAVNAPTLYIPRLLNVNVPPLMSAGRNRPPRARSVNSRRKPDSAPIGCLFAIGITAPTTPSFTAIATLMLISGFRRTPSPTQLAFIRGCFSSTRASTLISKSVIVGVVPAALPWLNFFCASISAPASTLCTRKKCGTLVQLCVVRCGCANRSGSGSTALRVCRGLYIFRRNRAIRPRALNLRNVHAKFLRQTPRLRRNLRSHASRSRWSRLRRHRSRSLRRARRPRRRRSRNRLCRRLLARRHQPRNRLPNRNHRSHIRRNSRQNPIARSFHFHHRFVRLNLKQRLALADALAFFLAPRQQLAVFLRHFQRRHHHTNRHSFSGSRDSPNQSDAATPSRFAPATISFTCLLGAASFSRVVESGPSTVK